METEFGLIPSLHPFPSHSKTRAVSKSVARSEMASHIASEVSKSKADLNAKKQMLEKDRSALQNRSDNLTNFETELAQLKIDHRNSEQ